MVWRSYFDITAAFFIGFSVVLANAAAASKADQPSCQSDTLAPRRATNFIQRLRQVDNRATIAPSCAPYPKKRIVLVTVNSLYVDMFQNWLHYAKRFLTDTEQLYVVAEDSEALTAIRGIESSSDLRFPIVHAETTLLDASFPFNSKKYGELVNQRPNHILNMLLKNCSVLYVDVDTVWLEDPFQEIANVGARDSHDLYVTHDTCKTHHPKDSLEFCTCFLYVQPSKHTKQLMEDWAHRLSSSHLNANQASFNVVMQKMLASSTRTLNWATLPQEKFPPGCSSKNHGSPAVLHANWRVGHAAKVKFFEDAGLWLADEKNDAASLAGHKNVSSAADKEDASSDDKHSFHQNTQSIHDALYHGVGKNITDQDLKDKIALIKAHSKGGGMEENEYFYFMSYVRDHAPQRLLVWGMGYDSIMLNGLNENGTTLFLEMDADWVAKTDAKHLNYYSYDDETFNTSVARWEEFLKKPHSAHIHNVENECWDTVLVDSPLGYRPTHVGRGVPIYTAKVIADNCTAGQALTVFVHDCNRKVEQEFTSAFLGTPEDEFGPKKLRKYVFSNATKEQIKK